MKKLLLLLTLALVNQLTFAQTVPSYVSTNGLVGYWGFNGNANDESGNGNNGTVNGSVQLTTDRFGNSNSSYLFPGNSSSYISVPGSQQLQIQSEITISAWILMDGGYYNPRIIDYGNYVNSGYSLIVSGVSNVSRTLTGLITNVGGLGVGLSSELNSLVWNHVCFVANSNGSGKLYINGVLVSTVNDTVLNNVSYIGDLNIGRMGHPAYDAWGGKLDDIGLWNRALTQQEIVQLYTGTTQTPAAIQSFTVNPDTIDHEGSTYAWSISPSAPLAVITGNGTNSISIAWGNTPEGNYSVQAIETNSLGCVTSTVNTLVYVAGPKILTVVSPVNYCCKATATPLTATPSTGSTLKWYSSATIKTALASAPTPLTTTSGSKTYYVSELNAAGVESARLPIVVNVRSLPITPTSITSTQSALICKYIGSTNEVTFTTTAVGEGLSYVWTVPEGASIISGDETASIGVSFENTSAAPGFIGAVTVKSVDANGCISLPKALALTTKVPTAPTALTMTSADSTPSFKGIITPADPLAVPPTPAVYGLVGLNTLAKIAKVGPYTGTSTIFTLTAPEAVTAASYLWTLPPGVNQLSGGTSNVITVDFADVTPETTALPIVVQSVGGCGNSTNRTLVLARAIPTAPTALTLTNSSQANLSSLTKITKVGPYTDTEIPFTLTATPFTTQGAEATSYAWVLPAGVVCTTPGVTATTVSGSTVIETVPTPWTYSAISSPTNTITVNFSGATGTGNLDLKVFGVNGAGNSIARTLTLARALPTAPTKLVLTDNAISTTVALTKVGAYTAKETPLTLTATPFTTQGAEATSFNWVLPAGVNVTAGHTNLTTPETDGNGNKTWTSTGAVLTINLAGISGTSPSMTSIPLSVYAVNGAGTSATAKTLTVTAAAPATPGSITTTATLGVPTYNPTCNSGIITVQVPNVYGVAYAWTVGVGATITSGQGTNSITINVATVSTTTLAISVVGSNGTGSSVPKSLVINKVSTCRTAAESITNDFSVVAYPNPSATVFTLDVSLAKGTSAEVQVYDMLGRLIEQRKVQSGTTPIGAAYPSGTYTLKVSQGENQKTVRVIKR